jgi:RNA polymerase sigma-70 factor (ECF subfamily)
MGDVPAPSPLSSLFLAHVGERTPSTVEARGLEEHLARILAAARSAWPELSLSTETFVPHLARCAGGGELAELGKLHADELYLACACGHGDGKALACFERSYVPAVEKVLARMNLGARLEDAKQLVRQHLFVAKNDKPPKILDYTGRGKLSAWLRVTAVRVTLDYLEKERPLGAGATDQELLDLPATGLDPELDHMKRLYRRAFKSAFEEGFLSLSARDQTLLRQHLLDGIGLEEVAWLYRVHRSTAARWLADARKRLLLRTRKTLMSGVGVDRAGCDEIMQLLESQLDLSISRLLRRASPQ